MPFMSDRAIVQVQNEMSRDKTALTKLKGALKDKSRIDTLKVMGGALGSAAVVGFARGKLEEANGAWNIPGTSLDIEMLALFAAAGLALAGEAVGLKKAQYPATLAVAGVGGHYIGQLARNTAKTGKFTLVAGGGRQLVAGQYDPTSYHPTQITAPFSDPVAQALASSGV